MPLLEGVVPDTVLELLVLSPAKCLALFLAHSCQNVLRTALLVCVCVPVLQARVCALCWSSRVFVTSFSACASES